MFITQYLITTHACIYLPIPDNYELYGSHKIRFNIVYTNVIGEPELVSVYEHKYPDMCVIYEQVTLHIQTINMWYGSIRTLLRYELISTHTHISILSTCAYLNVCLSVYELYYVQCSGLLWSKSLCVFSRFYLFGTYELIICLM